MLNIETGFKVPLDDIKMNVKKVESEINNVRLLFRNRELCKEYLGTASGFREPYAVESRYRQSPV